MAKLVAGELLAGWRRQMFELERLALASTSMTEQSIVRIADGHPLLRSAGYLPLAQAANVLGLDEDDLLRQAADGQLSLYCRLLGDSGYLTSYEEFEPDEPEQGTVLIPSLYNRPKNSRLHRAFGVFKVLNDDATALASRLLAQEEFVVLIFEALDQVDRLTTYVPSRSIRLGRADLEVSTAELDAFRRKLAESITPTALESARTSLRLAPEDTFRAKSRMPLSEAVVEYGRFYLPQVVTSAKEIERTSTGIALLAEFEGDPAIGSITSDMLRHFRDHHLSRMPANENRVRIKHNTKSMTESVRATEGTDWPQMSAGERDQRMQWIYRMLKWLHNQKWIVDDPSTALRGESVLSKAERKRAEANQLQREEFTPSEIAKIFGSPVFQSERVPETKAGTIRTFQPFHYWLPLMGLFTGARIGELTQLHLEDVKRIDEVWVIDINKKSEDKSLKNVWSARLVPLHPKLIELGFVVWCQNLAEAGYTRVFPELSWNTTNRYSKEPVRVMSYLLQNAGMARDGTKVFHSFRHGVNNELQKRSAMPDIMRKRVMGHEPGEGVNERHYLSDPKPSDMLTFIATMDMHLPVVSTFNINDGLKSIQHALRRKGAGRGASESLGPSSGNQG